MRNVRLTLWQMLLIVVLVVGVATSALAAVQRFFGGVEFPWLLPLLAVIAADAVVTQRVVRRERLGLAEQGALRTVEVVMVVVAVRLASLAAEELPLRQTAGTWLRDPLAFFGGQFRLYLVPTVVVWLGATLLAQSVLHLETELARGSWLRLPIEEAVVVEERAQAVAQFDRYWLLYSLLSLAGATVALYGVSLVQALKSWETSRPLVAVLGVVLSGLLLHCQGRLDQLAFRWQLGDFAVEPDVGRRAQSAGRVVSVVALLIGLALGGLAMLVPAPPLVPVLNGLLLVSTVLAALVIGLMSLLLLPFAWLLSLITGGGSPVSPRLPDLPVVQIPETSPERPLLPALIFWSCVVVLVGIAAVRYAEQRRDVRRLLARWPRFQRMLSWLRSAWSDAHGWSEHAVGLLRQRFRRERHLGRRQAQPGTGKNTQLRALYFRLIRAAEQRGVRHPPSQTPYEFRAAVGERLPSAAADVAVVTDVYVAAEYGPTAPPTGELRRARRAWRRAVQVLARAGKAAVRGVGREP